MIRSEKETGHKALVFVRPVLTVAGIPYVTYFKEGYKARKIKKSVEISTPGSIKIICTKWMEIYLSYFVSFSLGSDDSPWQKFKFSSTEDWVRTFAEANQRNSSFSCTITKKELPELRGTPVSCCITVEFQGWEGGRYFMYLILNTQPRLKFLEFLLVAPWSDQWITYLILIFPADFGNKI